MPRPVSSSVRASWWLSASELASRKVTISRPSAITTVAAHKRHGEQVQQVLVVVDEHGERAQRRPDREAEPHPVGQRDPGGLRGPGRSEADDQGRRHPDGVAEPARLVGAVAGGEQVDGVGDREQRRARRTAATG